MTIGMQERLAARMDAIERQLPFDQMDGLREFWAVSTDKGRAGIIDICLGEPKARLWESLHALSAPRSCTARALCVLAPDLDT
jgi:hypothetical protein